MGLGSSIRNVAAKSIPGGNILNTAIPGGNKNSESDSQRPNSHKFRNGVACVGLGVIALCAVDEYFDIPDLPNAEIRLEAVEPDVVPEPNIELSEITLSRTTPLVDAYGSSTVNLKFNPQLCVPIPLFEDPCGGVLGDTVSSTSTVSGTVTIESPRDAVTFSTYTDVDTGVNSLELTLDATQLTANSVNPIANSSGETGALIDVGEVFGADDVSITSTSEYLATQSMVNGCAEAPLQELIPAALTDVALDQLDTALDIFGRSPENVAYIDGIKANPVRLIIEGEMPIGFIPFDTTTSDDSGSTEVGVEADCTLSGDALVQFNEIRDGARDNYVIVPRG